MPGKSTSSKLIFLLIIWQMYVTHIQSFEKLKIYSCYHRYLLSVYYYISYYQKKKNPPKLFLTVSKLSLLWESLTNLKQTMDQHILAKNLLKSVYCSKYAIYQHPLQLPRARNCKMGSPDP
jgi:uncharacterized membrane protein